MIKIIMKIVAAILPFILFVFFTFLVEITLKPLHMGMEMFAFITAVIGLLCGLIIYYIIIVTTKKINILPPLFGKIYFLFIGGGLGLLSSLLCGTLFFFVHKPQISPFFNVGHLLLQILGNLFPAIVEEMGVRGGLVNVLSATVNNTVGILGGSLFFGFIHLVGRFFGNPVNLSHVLGYSIGGLLLTLIYMRYGLFCAVGWHCIWNALLNTWTKTFNLGFGGTQNFETTWTTSLILCIISVPLLYVVLKQRPVNIQNESTRRGTRTPMISH